MSRAALWVVVLTCPGLAMAQTGLELTPFGAYHWDGDSSWGTDDFFNQDVETASSGAFGVRLDIPLNRSLQLELLASRQSSELVARGGLFEPDDTLFDVDVDYYHVGVLWQWGLGQVRPYVVSSAGIGRLAPDSPGLNTEERFSVSFGGGVKIFVGDHLGFRFEGRGFWTDLEANGRDLDDCRHRHRDCYQTESALVQAEASAGIILAF